MKDAKQILRELVEEVIEEMTATGAVAGYQTPNAFGKNPQKKRDAARSMPGGEVVGDIDTDTTTVGEGERLTMQRSLTEGHEDFVPAMLQNMKPGMTENEIADVLWTNLYDYNLNVRYSGDARKAKTATNNRMYYIDGGDFVVDMLGEYKKKFGEIKYLDKTAVTEGRSRYRNFKESDLMKNHAKISYGVNQAKKMLSEVEYLLNICERLKTEAGVPTTNLWKRTKPDMQEIHKRLKAIAKKIHNMGR